MHLPNHAASMKRRGRGRPRNDWTLDRVKPTVGDRLGSRQPSRTTPLFNSSASTPSSVLVDHDEESLHISQAELLIHFINHTSKTLAGDKPILEFWKQNVPQIGLSHPFVLHLILALAAFHMAHDDIDVATSVSTSSSFRRSCTEYLSLAHRHFTAGLSGFTAQLSHPGPHNCGSLYLGAMLTTYCAFAAGPTSDDDLLVCTAAPSTSREVQDSCADQAAATTAPGTWIPFVYGVRLLHESFSPNVLFAGLMEPLMSGSSEDTLSGPVCVRDGFQRLDWEDACLQLSNWVGDKEDEACRLAMDTLLGIYAAMYGYSKADGEVRYTGPSVNQFVFGWLYRMDSAFLQCVRRRDPRALLVLAYYAVLLNKDTVREGWYIKGWRRHIIDRVERLLGEENDHQFIQWPKQVVRDWPGDEKGEPCRSFAATRLH